VTISRSNPRAKQRWTLLATGVVALMLLATAVLAVVEDGTTADQCDVQVPSKSGPAEQCTTDAGALVSYIPSSGDDQSSGTGIFDPFVRLQGSPAEKGYNTDGTLQFESKAGKWTHAILVSAIPIVTVNGVDYWELFVDINEGNNAKQVSLNEVEIWFTTNQFLTGYVDPTGFPAASGATLEYDFEGTILINDVNQGSGRGDLKYLIPLTDIPTPPAGTWFLLYSEWGGTTAGPTFISDGGFEEWKVRKVPPRNTIATQVMNTNDEAADTAILDGATVPIGTVVYDTATLTNATSDAGGTVSYFYQLQLPADTTPNCLAGTQIGSAVAVAGAVVPNSATVPLNAAGTYEFWAVYSGDPTTENNASTSPCGSETVVVAPNNPSLATTPSTQIRDSFSVSGLTSNATGTVTVKLFAPSNATCSEEGGATFAHSDVFTIGTNGTFAGGTYSGTTPYHDVTADGTWRWVVSYSGDANNQSKTSPCGEESVTVTTTARASSP